MFRAAAFAGAVVLCLLPSRKRAQAPANQLSAELIKAIATGLMPDVVTMDNPNVSRA
jgi:hypothetical protein